MTTKHASLYRLLLLALLLGLALPVPTVSAAQTATFTTHSYPILGNNHIAVDLNGDGQLDLAGTGLNSASVILGNGNGTFRTKVDYPAAGQTQDLAAGDFNGDGKVDLVVTTDTPEIMLSLLTGNGDGTLNAPVNFPNTSGFDSPSVVATDLNNDGKLDVVIAHQIAAFTAPMLIGDTISVMLGNGDGTFQPSREIRVGKLLARIAVGDFNRDGIKDLAICGDSAQLYILIGLGDGTFAQQPTIKVISTEPGGVDGTDVDIADLNGDAIQDLVVAYPTNGSRTAILLGNGDGSFGAPSIILEPNLRVPQQQALADYDGDGKIDLALSLGYGTDGLIEILNGNGDGTFQPLTLYLKPAPLSSIAGAAIVSADFNGDRKPDIALAVGGASTALNVLINTTGTSLPSTPVTVSSLTFSPTTVTGGTASTGTVTLSASVQTATVVQLSSNRSATTVPSSVTVTAGASSANFTVNTLQVSATTTAIITATLNGTSRSGSLVINGPDSTTDTLSITRAEYEVSKRTLRVETTSTRSNATLQVFITSSGQLIGTLTNTGRGQFRGQFNVSVNPQSITVRSNFGGQATRTVRVK